MQINKVDKTVSFVTCNVVMAFGKQHDDVYDDDSRTGNNNLLQQQLLPPDHPVSTDCWCFVTPALVDQMRTDFSIP